MESVTVLRQSDAIFEDPSNYWISVINAGRHFSLSDVMGPDMTDSQGVGIVIARLMRLADVAGVEPVSVALPTTAKVEKSMLSSNFFPEKLPGVVIPEIIVLDGGVVRLQPDREIEALKTENDEYFLLDDPKVGPPGCFLFTCSHCQASHVFLLFS
jgi:hypothetical protein